MTRQEEIREGVAKYFERTDYGWSALDYANGVLKYLNSQGLVLKVERELPELPSTYEHEDNNYLYCQAQDDMLEAGYEAVESLVSK